MSARTICFALATMFACVDLLAAQEAAKNQKPKAAKPGPDKKVWAVDDFLKVIPNASAAIVVPNQKRLITRAKPISEEVGVNNMFTPETAVSLAKTFLGITAGDDPEGPIAFMSMKPALSDEAWVLAFAYQDLKKLTNGELKPDGSIVLLDRFINRQSMFAMAKDNCVWLARDEDVLKEVLKAKTLHETISPDERRELANADVLVHLSPKTVRPGDMPEDAIAEIIGDRKELQAAVGLLVTNFDAFRFTLTFDKGIRSQIRASFNDKPELHEVLTKLLGTGQSNLNGLPLDSLIAGGAFDGTSEGPPEMLRRGLMNWTPFWWQNEVGDMQITAISELFREVAEQVRHSAIGTYRNADNTKGAMNLVAVLTPKETPEKFVEELRSLSTFVSARVARDLRIGNVTVDSDEIERLIQQLKSEDQRERSSAATKLNITGQPALASLDKVAASDDETLNQRAASVAQAIRRDMRFQNRVARGKSFKGVKPQFLFRRNSRKPKRPVIEILLKEDEATDKINRRLTPLFGPSWKRMRFAVLEKHVVVLFGSNEELLEQVATTVAAGGNPLARKKSVIDFRKFVGEQRLAEWHFSIADIIALSQARSAPAEKRDGLSSLSLSRKPAQVRGDFFLPSSELKAWYESTQIR